MKLYQLHEEVQITHWSEDMDDLDPWVTADQADKVAADSKIRISNNKQLTLMAVNGDTVIGGVWSAIDTADEQPYYDFDVAVSPAHRNSNVGLKLIEAAIQDAIDNDIQAIKVYVINPKLIKVLERRYGFEIEAEHGHGTAHMVKYL